MKILLSFFIVCFACIACNDAVDLTSLNKDLENRDATVSPQGIIVPTPYRWSSLPDPDMDSGDAYDFVGRILKCNGHAYAHIGEYSHRTYRFHEDTKTWELNPVNFEQFLSSYNYLFSNGSYLYGVSQDGQKRVGALNVNTGNFIILSSPFPGVTSLSSAKVTIGNNAYLLGGRHNGVTINQYLKYDFVRDQWTNLGDLPGGHRAWGSAFVVQDKIYFGLGYQEKEINNTVVRTYKADWLVIDPNNSKYAITRANFPAEPRAWVEGFVINNKIYLGGGEDNSSPNDYNDFWEFNPSTNTWTEKQTPHHYMTNLNLFSIGDTGYALQFPSLFWQYSNSPFLVSN